MGATSGGADSSTDKLSTSINKLSKCSNLKGGKVPASGTWAKDEGLKGGISLMGVFLGVDCWEGGGESMEGAFSNKSSIPSKVKGVV